jgi:hypothetical protein
VFEKHWVNPTGTLYTSKVYLFEVPNRWCSRLLENLESRSR